MFCDDEKCKGRDVGSRVIDSRQSADKLSIRRRRECSECGKRFTTHERLEEFELIVIKKDGSTQAYDKSKIVSKPYESIWLSDKFKIFKFKTFFNMHLIVSQSLLIIFAPDKCIIS